MDNSLLLLQLIKNGDLGGANLDLNLTELGLKEVKVIFNGEFENVDFWAAQYKKLIDVNESDLTISWGSYSGNGCNIQVDGGNYIGPDVEEDTPSLSYNKFDRGIHLFNLQNWAGPIQITVTPLMPK